MFNVAVIKLRDLLKYLLVITTIIAIVLIIKRYFNKEFSGKINLGQISNWSLSEYIKKSIEIELPEFNQIEKEKNEEILIDENIENSDRKFETKFLNKMLELELSAINIKDEKIEKEDNTIIEENIEENVEEKIEVTAKQTETKNEKNKSEESEDEVKTEVVTKNPLVDAYTKEYNGVKIKNETVYDLSEDDLNANNLKINKSNIIIFHTHTCESYTSSEKYSYTPTGKFRTTDLKYSVARVGDELTKYLKGYKINVIHNKTYHDYPSYTGSYTRSLSTVSSILKNTNSDILIDLHRDAIGSNSSYAPTVKIGEEYCAQLMFVMGSNGGGLNHPNWKKNLQFTVRLQEIGNKMYPGLFKPIILRNSRYNQHLGKAACIIEVGATGNTLEQCINSMKYLAKIINDY